MARFTIAVNASRVAGSFSGGRAADVLNGSTIAADQATVDADVATLVADGATPTQAHVNTLNTDWTALAADIAGTYPASSDVVVSIDAANVVSIAQLRAALDRVVEIAAGGSELTQ